MQKEVIKKECIEAIDKIFNEYNDDMVFNRIKQYISNQMPVVIKNYSNQQMEKNNLLTEHDYFVEYFLNNNQYFYVSNTSKFFYYDGNSYKLYTEDDILHNVLRTISQKKLLQPWKQKTKNNIMRRIKEKSLLNTIPESETIQKVINLFINCNMFDTKEEVKYFLAILGDNILKKNTNVIHIINNESKDFLRELNSICYGFIGITCNNSFKFKFHDHNYDDTRLLNIKNVEKILWEEIVLNNTVDILCVGCHYSNRYGSSDSLLLETNVDDKIIEHILFLKNLTHDKVINNFIKEYIEITITKDKIKDNLIINKDSELILMTMKDMQYLWRHYLNSKNLPNIIFQNVFKKSIIEKFNNNYNSEIDSFIGLSSQYLPKIKLFLEYWTDNVSILEIETDYDFEISEIILLFKLWVNNNYNTSVNISEKKTLDIITYFFPQLLIEQNKYIYNIKCKLWDKNSDIQLAIDSFETEIKDKYDNKKETKNIISIYDIYNYYCKMFKDSKLIVGKQYFEKFIFNNYENSIVDDNYLHI